MTLNDFKSVQGDRQMGIGSLPVRLGVDAAARTACWMMAGPQVAVIALLVFVGHPAARRRGGGVAAGTGPLDGLVHAPAGAACPLLQRLRRAAVRGRHDGQRLCLALGGVP